VQSNAGVRELIDKSGQGNFSDDELNPLLNPLLAANMGRWAEVYCTNPPEKRDQAVVELIRELHASATSENPAGVNSAPNIGRPVQPTLRVPAAPPSANFEIICVTCGGFNPEGQRFCGMCGTPVTPEQPVPERSAANSYGRSTVEAARHFFYGEGADAADEADERTGLAERYHQFEFRPAAQEDLPSFAREVPQTPYRYRLYLGIALAIVFGGLFYWARYRTEVFSSGRDPQVIKSAPEAPSISESAGTAPAENPQKNENSPQNQVAASQPPVAQRQEKNTTPSPESVLATRAASTVSTATNGAEERSQAEKYLSGNQRDGGEAAQWLWKAVAKGNGSSAIELADLYLRGDGVSKNCDQGRLLLDVAAKKGIKAAAVQLQNLQAFGCH
jgi:hypothetical protein